MKSEIEASNIAGMTQEAFSVSEVLEISSGKQAAGDYYSFRLLHYYGR